MKKILLMSLVVAVLFGVSAASSWVLSRSHPTHGEKAEGNDSPADKALKGKETQAAVRPPFNVDADGSSQMAASLRAQAEVLRQREQKVEAREKNLETIRQTISAEKAVIDGMRKQCDEELKILTAKLEALERKASEVEHKSTQVQGHIKSLEEGKVKMGDAEREKVQQLAKVYDTMDAEKAAQQLQQMADKGMLDMAVKILAAMKERQAANVLAAFTDQATAVQLVDRMLRLDAASTGTKTGQ